jgi:gliding motility-associated-like protein
MYVDLVNTGSTTLNNVYYFRGLDPDNDQPWPLGGFPTKNTIIFQPNAISKNCLVTGEGLGYPKQAYLGLGTKDCRAKCMYFSSWPPSASLNDMYNQTGSASTGAGYSYAVGSTASNDWGVGVVWNLGNLGPGQKTSLAYTYILKQADLDTALGETAPKFESDGVPYAPYTTFRVCPGNTVPLKVVNGGQYRWIWTPGTDMAASGASVKIPAGGTVPTVTGSTIYPDGGVYGDSCLVTVRGPKTYTAMGISNCDTQFLVFYVDTISFTTPPSVTTPIRYCEGATATALTAGTAAGATLRWYTTGSGGTSTLAPPVPPTIFGGLPGDDFDTVSYWVSQVNPAGCETPRAKIDVIITRKPLPPLVDSQVYCIGSTTEMVTATGTLIKWYDAATAGTQYPGAPTPANTPAGTTVYYASQTINGCESDRSPLSVEISEATADFELSADSLCGPELLVLENKSKTSVAGTSYTNAWTFGDGGSSTDSNTSHSYADARADYTVKLVVTNIHGCSDEIEKVVKVFPQPEISLSASDTMICQGDVIDFTGVATAGYLGLKWDFGDGDPAYDELAVRHAFTASGIFNVVFSGTYPACDGVNASTPVTIIAIPNVNLGRDTAYCPGSVALTLANLNATPGERYLWSTGDSTASITIHHQGDYWLRATNWQCTASDSITVSKACYMDIPNAFRPGSGDGSESHFLPRQLLSKSITTFEMKIFDRWGQLLFQSDKINGEGWDGNFKGQEMPFGVYVYLIKVSFANGITESYEGNVTLVR